MNDSVALQGLISRLGYTFRNPALLRQALTHRSRGSGNNERLEFLGDSVLSLAVSTRLYRDYPQLTEGELSRLRSYLVKEASLAEVAKSIRLGETLVLGEGELKSGGFRRPSILADTMEAVFGAVYVDGGLESAVQLIESLYRPLLDHLDPNMIVKDPKTTLQEHLQSRQYGLPRYAIVSTHGEAHDQTFEVECLIPALNIRAVGLGTSRRNAEQEAARSAFLALTATSTDNHAS